ncbi:hypothetical protein, partial [Halorubellus sp. PRR65]|uniref:hypothetical protein n=1 Tax=Halorubellus sp. PRR65 TaxID=3098148 RepID=UPI002B26067E
LCLLSFSTVAFDEDFEAEVIENQDARIEVSSLSTSPDPELTEVGAQIKPLIYLNIFHVQITVITLNLV